MKTRAGFHPRSAGTLLVTLAVLTAVSMMAAYMLIRVMPRIRMAYQNAAWQESRISAEAGIDAAMGDLLRNATGLNAANWAGWQESTPVAPPGGTVPKGLLKQLNDTPADRQAKVLAKIAKHLDKAALPAVDTVQQTSAIYLDNLKISAQGGVSSEVDVQLWGLDASVLPHSRWFKIRAMATTAIPSIAYEAPAFLEAQLRRFSLRTVRPTILRNDVGIPSTVRLPNVSRTVEVLVEPVMPFELAVWAADSISLGAFGLWNIDSFDSSDDAKSAAGLYPGRTSPLIQLDGSIACGRPRPFDALYGPSIEANGAEVKGAVATNGGDDPTTPEHENVAGAMRINPARIRDDFTREMPMVNRPPIVGALPPPPAGTPFTVGTDLAPAIYHVTGSLTDLRITAPPKGTTGAIVVMIDGDLKLAGPLILPPEVVAILYVRGNMSFADSVNSGPWSTNRAAQLLIFGDAPGTQTLKVSGAVTVTASFYGPHTEVALDGTVDWIGSLAAARFAVYGAGDGGVHYDRAVAPVGPPVSFRIVRYVEDVRQ